MKSIATKYMKFSALRIAALFTLLILPVAYSQAQVRVGIGFGVGPGYVAGPPVCSYGYYPDYPYGCAPYGYYGPSWFSGGIFIGAGPWYHGFGRPFYPSRFGWGRGFDGRYAGRGFGGRGYEGRGFEGRGFGGRGYDHGHFIANGRGSEGHGPSRGSSGGFHGGSRGGGSRGRR